VALQASLTVTPSMTKDLADIELFLNGGDPTRVIAKLKALSDLFEEICVLLNVPNEKRSLEILRIEVGSLYIIIRGAELIMGLLADFIREAAWFVYRNRTTEGKISTIPKKLEILERELHISERLQKMGIDTTDTNEYIQRCSVKIVSHLNELLTDVSSVAVNRETIPITLTGQRPFLKASPLQIEQAKDGEERDDNGEEHDNAGKDPDDNDV